MAYPHFNRFFSKSLAKSKFGQITKFSTFHARYELQSAVIARARKKIKLKKKAIKKNHLISF